MSQLGRTILIVILVLLLITSLPLYHRFNDDWGWGPAGILGAALVVVTVLMRTGKF
jgi:hypothetical protein